ncbi:MAG TPA: hypothetical protein VGI90_09895 [Steroidobacteraceae bacterium]
MPVKRRTHKRRTELSPESEDWLHGEDEGDAFAHLHTRDDLRNLWRSYEEEILQEWIAESPGTRPARWWELSAPEPRRRLGGVGTPSSERLAYVESYTLGVPDSWVSDDDLDAYKLIGSPLNVPAIDPRDPPQFESQAMYLKRLDLLQSGERRLARTHFEPESIIDIMGMDAADL